MKKLLAVLIMLVAVKASGQWIPSNVPVGATTYALANSGTNVYAGTYFGGMFLSTNNGTNWTPTGWNQWVWSLAVSGTSIFAGTENSGIYLSTNNGSIWTTVNNGLTHLNVCALAVLGTNIFAGTYNGGVFKSTNSGTNWIAVNNGLTTLDVRAFAVSGTNIFAGTYNGNGGVFLSTNNGASWTTAGLANKYIWSLAVSGTNIFAGTLGEGVFLSTNNGTSWAAKNNGLTNLNVNSLAVSGTNIFAGTGSGGVFLSTNNGTSWVAKNQGFNVISTVYTLLIANNYIFSGTFTNSTSTIWRRTLSEILNIQNIGTEIPSSFSLSQNYPNPFNPTTNIKFDVAKPGPVKLSVFDITGREVQTLVNENLKAGTYEATFDGSGLNSGVYFYRMVTDGYSETKRAVLIK